MKKILCALMLLGAMVSCGRGDDDPRLVIITLDGLRWHEVFGGVDPEVVFDTRYVKDTAALAAKYWRDTPEERRAALMPFTWDYIASHGYLLGNRWKDSRMQVSNHMNFSYPGYSELFCGYADDERVHSNDPKPNPNTSVLEVVNRDPRYKGSVMVYTSWESIRFAVNNERGGIPASVAFEPNASPKPSPGLIMLDEMNKGMTVKPFGNTVRLDAFTYGYALETIRNDHPKVLYIGFGETDEWSHKGEYDTYVEIAHISDAFFKGIVEACESDPFYKGKTTYIITCDHGRGEGFLFQGHGRGVKASEQTWFMEFGPGVPVLGETSDNGPFYTRQFAAEIARILGVDFTPDNGVKYEPFDPTFRERKAPELKGSFKSVPASPKGLGVRYSYYEGNFTSVEEVLKSPVKSRGIAPSLSFDGISRVDDYFGFEFSALLKIEQSGDYYLSLASIDGSKLYLDGQLLIDCNVDGGGYDEVYINLEKGWHRIRIPFFEYFSKGMEHLQVGLKGPGVEPGLIPPSMLYYE